MAPVRAAMLLWVLIATGASPQPVRRVLQNEHAFVSYDPIDEAFARTALEEAGRALPILKRSLGLDQGAKDEKQLIRLDITRRQDDFDRLVGSKTKPWVQAIAVGSERRIVLKTLLPSVARTVVGHELTHILLDELAAQEGVDPPRWLHEGLAKYATSDFTEADRVILGQAIRESRLLTLDQLEAAFAADHEQVTLAYAQSYTLVRHLHELQPGGGLHKFLSELAHTHDYKRALIRTYGQPPERLEHEWLQQTRNTYATHGLPLAAEWVIWGSITVVAITALALNERRRRRIRTRLQEEERQRRMFGDTSSDTIVWDDEPPEGETYLP